MNELRLFNNPEFGELHMIEIDGKPYAGATSIAKILGYVNPNKAISQHCRWVTKRVVPHPQNPNKTIEMNFIPEGDLYRLIVNSKLPKAQEIESWIFDDVLPSISRTGSYNFPQLSTNEMMLQIAQNAVELERQLNEQNKAISLLQESNIRTEQKLDTAINIFAKPTGTWKDGMELAIREMIGEGGWSTPKLKSKLYQELEIITSCDLGNRQLRMRKRLKKQGATYREQMAVTKLDIISKDKQLRTVFESIVRNYQAIYGLENINGSKDQEELIMKDYEAVEKGLRSLGYKDITDLKYEPCGYLRDTIILNDEVLGIWDYQKNTFVD